MKTNRKILVVMFTVVFLILLAACANSSDKSSGGLDSESQKNKSIQSENDEDSSPIDSTSTDHADTDETESISSTDNTDADNTENNNANEEVESSTNIPAKEEQSTNTTASMKEEYLKKFNDTKKEVEDIRKEYSDDTPSVVLKKVESDRNELWDGLLNEVYDVLKEQLSAKEMDQLRNEQRDWIKYKDDTAKEASLKYKGGTAEHLEYVMVLANVTEERCYELIEDYMK